MGERVPSAAVTEASTAAVCDLHFWVWGAKGVSTASALPSAEVVSAANNPKLCEQARQQAWLLVSTALVAVGKSHGAYDRKEGVATCKISLVLEVRHARPVRSCLKVTQTSEYEIWRGRMVS